jgi:hypothetical protein
MECKFIVGQKVTLKRALSGHGIPSPNGDPELGKVYAIAELHFSKEHNTTYLRFAEFYLAYWYDLFKPVHSTEAGMTILRGLLKTYTKELETIK